MRVQFESCIINVKTDCICRKFSSGRSGTTEETVNSAQQPFPCSPRTSTHLAGQELHLSQSTLWRILRKCLTLHRYKPEVLQNIMPNDKVLCFEFYCEMIGHLGAGETCLFKTFPQAVAIYGHFNSSAPSSHQNHITSPTCYKQLFELLLSDVYATSETVQIICTYLV